MREDALADARHGQARRRRVEQDQPGIAHEAERAHHQDRDHEEARERIDDGRAAEVDRDPRHERGHGAQRVADEVEPRAAQVEVMRVGGGVVPFVVVVSRGGHRRAVIVAVRVTRVTVHRAVQDPRAEAVHRERRHRHHQHDAGTRHVGVSEVLERVAHDLDRHPEHERAVHERGQRLHPAEPEREALVRLARREAHRPEADGKREHIHEEVVGVRLEDVAPRGLCAEELDEEERPDREQHDEEPPRLPPLVRRVPRAAHAAVMIAAVVVVMRVPRSVRVGVAVRVLVRGRVAMIGIVPGAVIMRVAGAVVVLVAHHTRTKSSPIDVVDPASTLIVSSSRSTAARYSPDRIAG